MLSLLSDDVRRDPFPLYAGLRSGHPVLHAPEAELWLLFDYAGVKRALSDPEAFSSSMLAAGRANPPWLIFFDPPRHTKLRALVNRAFTSRSVAALEPRIRELSRALLDPHLARGEMDLAGDYAIPLPMMVIAEMLGIPSSDWPRFREWSDAILRLSYTIEHNEESARAGEEYKSATAEMAAYLPQLVEERLSVPRDDLLTRLVQAEVDGERLTPEELLGFFQLLLVAGNETTTNLINNAMLCLMENPEELRRLRTEPSLLPSAIEETLRHRSPVQWVFRATTRDVELHGQVIPAGELVLAVLGSANRDPLHFRDADRFDITRDPNPHLAFGHGLHFCLGAPLSRLEARIALTDLLGRLGDFEPASTEPWEPRKALHVYGPNRLPIRFRNNSG